MPNLRAIVQKTRNRLTPGARILLYHRVAPIDFDPQWLNVSPNLFEEQMRILRKEFRPIDLPDAVNALAEGNLPRNAVVVTFDDGYADNLHFAKPILEKYQIPATVFVATGYLGREFWWDELENLILRPEKLPDVLNLEVQGQKLEWKLTNQETTGGTEKWTIYHSAFPDDRFRLYSDLGARMKIILPEERNSLLRELGQWSAEKPETRESHRALTKPEVTELGQGSLVEIGAHTVTHSRLEAQPAEQQKFEIEESKRCVEEILKAEVTSFSYPFGGIDDYSQETATLAGGAGFERACTAMPYCARAHHNRMEIPRFFVRDWQGGEFQQKLESFISQ